MDGFIILFVILLGSLAIQLLVAVVRLIRQTRRSRRRCRDGTPSGHGHITTESDSRRKASSHRILTAGAFFVTLLAAISVITSMLLEPAKCRSRMDWILLPFLGLVLLMQYLAWRHPDLCAITIFDPLKWFLHRHTVTDAFRCNHCSYNLTGHLDSLRDASHKVICPECGKDIDEAGLSLPGFVDHNTVARFKANAYLILTVVAFAYLCLVVVLRFWLISFPFVAMALWFTVHKWQQYRAATDA